MQVEKTRAQSLRYHAACVNTPSRRTEYRYVSIATAPLSWIVPESLRPLLLLCSLARPRRAIVSPASSPERSVRPFPCAGARRAWSGRCQNSAYPEEPPRGCAACPRRHACNRTAYRGQRVRPNAGAHDWSTAPSPPLHKHGAHRISARHPWQFRDHRPGRGAWGVRPAFGGGLDSLRRANVGSQTRYIAFGVPIPARLPREPLTVRRVGKTRDESGERGRSPYRRRMIRHHIPTTPSAGVLPRLPDAIGPTGRRLQNRHEANLALDSEGGPARVLHKTAARFPGPSACFSPPLNAANTSHLCHGSSPVAAFGSGSSTRAKMPLAEPS